MGVKTPFTQEPKPQTLGDATRVGKPARTHPNSPLARIKKAFAEKFQQEPTQTAIAQQFGKDQTTVSAWGRDALPEIRLGIDIAKRLRMTLDYLYLGKEPEKAELPLFLRVVEEITRDFSNQEKARVIELLHQKAMMLKDGVPVSIEDAIRKLEEDPLRHN
jgi:transposase-like protein